MTDLPTTRGKFNLLRKIGEGGMAEVFLAERGGDEGFRTMVALKRLHSGFALDQYFIRQLVAEARLLGQLQHNNVVRVHDFRRIEDEYFIVMEYIDGIDLAQAIHVHREHELTFPLSVFFHLALCICEALDYAHTATDLNGKPMQLIHRDIKPSNVLISQRGIVKLTDFGIARVADSTHTGSVVKGTANYMSPEQASGEQDLTPASDIFSLGAVFWETLTLEKLVDGSNYLNVIDSIKGLNVGLKDITRRGIEPALRMILLRMLAHKSDLRYQSMSLVLKDLRFVADQMKVDLSPAHLQEYMTRIIKLARESAVRGAAQGRIGPSGEATPPTPVPAKPSPPVPEAESDDGEKGFADSVAALQNLVQTGTEIEPVSPVNESSDPAAQTSASSVVGRSVAPPSASPPSAPALKARPELAVAAGVAGGTDAASPPAPSAPLVRRNTAGGASSSPAAPPAAAPAAPPAAPAIGGEGPASERLRQTQPGVPSPSAPLLPPQPLASSMVTDESYSPTTGGEYTQGDWDDEEEEEDYYRSRRRANMIVLGIGAPAVLLLLGVIFWLLANPSPDSTDSAEAPVAVTTEPSSESEAEDSLEVVITEETEEEDGEASARAPVEEPDLIVEAGDAPVDGRSRREVESYREPEPAPSREVAREPDPAPEFARPAPEPQPELSWDEPEEQPAAVPEPVVEASPEPPPRPSRDDDWAVASAPASTDPAVAEPAASAGPLNATALKELAAAARRGALSDSDLDSLRAVEAGSETYNTGRALLLAHFEARRDTRAHCEVAAETLRQPANRAAPQFHLEMSKCYLRQGRHQDALESARIAEMNAQDIPARVRADRQLKIWEVQAKAYKGLYQSTDELDYIAHSIAVWKRYKHMAENTYRQRESDHAAKEIRSLEALQSGAL